MFDYLDAIDPGVEPTASGNSMSPLIIVGIVLGLLLLVGLIVFIVKRNK